MLAASGGSTTRKPQTWRSSDRRFCTWRLGLKDWLCGVPLPNGSSSMILHWPSLGFYPHFKISGYRWFIENFGARFWITFMRGATQWFSVFPAEVSFIGARISHGGLPAVMWWLCYGTNSEASPSSNPLLTWFVSHHWWAGVVLWQNSYKQDVFAFFSSPFLPSSPPFLTNYGCWPHLLCEKHPPWKIHEQRHFSHPPLGCVPWWHFDVQIMEHRFHSTIF